MAEIDTPETDAALRAFQAAWQCAVVDYADRRINSEQCLQAALYSVLRGELPQDFFVFSEAAIHLSDTAQSAGSKRKVVTDLVVCHRDQLVLGIELKYLPRFEPSRETLAKDVMSLSHLTNRHAVAERAHIEMPRFRHADGEAMALRVLSQRKLIVAIFCSEDARRFSEETFWVDHRPTAGFWADRDKMPMNLGLAFARARVDGTAVPSYVGGPFERLVRRGSSESARRGYGPS